MIDSIKLNECISGKHFPIKGDFGMLSCKFCKEPLGYKNA